MNTASFSTLDDFLGDRQQRFFGSGYKSTELRVYRVTMDRAGRTLNAALDIDIMGGWSAHHGKERKYHLSNVEALVVAGQTAQALLYWLDGLKREEVDNLWLRGLAIVNNRPIEKHADIPVRVLCREFEESAIRGEKWRVTTLDILIDGTALAIKNYKACYRLPR